MEDNGKCKEKRRFRIQERLWINFLIRAVNEDLNNNKANCANKCCDAWLPKKPKTFGYLLTDTEW